MSINEIMTYLWQTALMTLIATFAAYLVGLPTGVLLNITSKKGIKPCKWINIPLGIIVNILRSVPCLILVVIFIPLTRNIFGIGIGEWYTILIPLFVTAFGFVARMVEQSLQEVPVGEIEAIKSLGASNWQLITKVLLPESRSSLISSAAVTTVAILGYTSFAANIGAGGLIHGIWMAYRSNPTDFLNCWYFWVLLGLVVLIVQGVQELGLYVSKKIDKRRITK